MNDVNFTTPDRLKESTINERLQVAEPQNEFEETFNYNAQPLLWGNLNNTNGTVTHLSNKSGKELKIGSASGDKLTRQTRQYFHYVPSFQKSISFALSLPESTSGLECRLGYWDDSDGAYIERKGSTINLVRRSSADGSVTDDKVAQKNWNVDRMDGSTKSNINLDLSNIQMMQIDFMFYGGGAIVFKFQIADELFKAHVFQGGNKRSNPIVGNPNLPIRYEIENTESQSSDQAMEVFGGKVDNFGTREDSRQSFPFSEDTGDTVVSLGDAAEPVLSIRPKSNFNSQTNRGNINTQTFQVFALDGPSRYKIVKNGTLQKSGSDVPSSDWNSVDGDSITESNTTADSISGGRVIDRGVAPTGSQNKASGADTGQLNSREPLTLDVDGSNNDRMSIVMEDFTGQTNPSVYAKMAWRERY